MAAQKVIVQEMPTTAPTEKENFLEKIRRDDANAVNLDEYRFIGFDPYRGYMFMRRQKRKGASS